MLNGVTQKLMRAKRQSMRMAGVMVEHRCGRFMVHLPADHNLPIYQRDHKQYDRFLPVLVKRIDGSGTVIDVGANVGDTLAWIPAVDRVVLPALSDYRSQFWVIPSHTTASMLRKYASLLRQKIFDKSFPKLASRL